MCRQVFIRQQTVIYSGGIHRKMLAHDSRRSTNLRILLVLNAEFSIQAFQRMFTACILLAFVDVERISGIVRAEIRLDATAWKQKYRIETFLR